MAIASVASPIAIMTGAVPIPIVGTEIIKAINRPRNAGAELGRPTDCDNPDVRAFDRVTIRIGIAERLKSYDGFVALGCVIRGETTHYDTVCNDSSRALTLLGLQGLCIGNGILTVENRTQAEVRADPENQNKGGGAAAAALHLIALSRKWGAARKGVGFKPVSDELQIASDTTS